MRFLQSGRVRTEALLSITLTASISFSFLFFRNGWRVDGKDSPSFLHDPLSLWRGLVDRRRWNAAIGAGRVGNHIGTGNRLRYAEDYTEVRQSDRTACLFCCSLVGWRADCADRWRHLRACGSSVGTLSRGLLCRVAWRS